MTLIIGVKCRDGIVIGSDSLETFGTDIEQEVSNKIDFLAKDSLIASAGAVGLSQLIKDKLRSSWETVQNQEDVYSARILLEELIWSEIKRAMDHVSEAQEFLQEDLIPTVLTSSLLAFLLKGTPRLLRVNEIGQSSEVSYESPFVSIGSGDFQADPFLAFVKRVVWNDKQPKAIDDGVFGVLWALQHVIEVNAGLGVGGRPVIATLQRLDGIWEADIMKGPRLDQNLQRIREAEIAVRTFLDELYADESSGSIQDCSY